MRSLLIALQFLSRLPVQLPGRPTPEEMGRSALCYPLVGFLLGLLLLLADALLDGLPAALHAALLLALWVALSGALHLDGLADTADAWVGGLGDAERSLAIMKDPRSGPVAVVVLVLVLLLKFSALLALAEADQALPVLLAMVLGRTALLGLFLTTPYVRRAGLGRALAEHLPRAAARRVLLATAALVLLGGPSGVLALLLAGAAFMVLRGRLLRRLGGTTGDTAGALLELIETLVVVGLAA